jgi:beta-mannanase
VSPRPASFVSAAWGMSLYGGAARFRAEGEMGEAHVDAAPGKGRALFFAQSSCLPIKEDRFDVPVSRAISGHSGPTLSRRQLIAGGAAAATSLILSPHFRASGLEMAPIGLGAWIPNVLSDVTEIDKFTAMVGTAPSIIQYFLSWSDGGYFDAGVANGIVARGATPMLSWNSHDWRSGVDQPEYANARIVGGGYDDLIRRWARDLAAWGNPFFLRIDDEMNGNWNPWSVGVNGNSLDDYLAMWRHIVTLFRQERASNVRFVWSPNVVYQGEDVQPFVSMYPGDDFVDWVALDGYNWGATRVAGWQDFSAIFADSYAAMAQLTSRPLMIAEIGSVEAGGDKAAWMRQAFLTDIPQRFQRIRAVVWFNEDRSPEGEADFRINTSLASLQQFSEIARAPFYRGSVQ